MGSIWNQTGHQLTMYNKPRSFMSYPINLHGSRRTVKWRSLQSSSGLGVIPVHFPFVLPYFISLNASPILVGCVGRCSSPMPSCSKPCGLPVPPVSLSGPAPFVPWIVPPYPLMCVVVPPPLAYAFSTFCTPGVLKGDEEGVPSGLGDLAGKNAYTTPKTTPPRRILGPSREKPVGRWPPRRIRGCPGLGGAGEADMVT